MNYHHCARMLMLVLALSPTVVLATPPTPTADPMGMPGGMVMPTLPAATTMPEGRTTPTPQGMLAAGAGTATPGTTPTPPGTFPTARVSVGAPWALARVRDLPNINGGSSVLELLAQGQTVQLYKQLADHSWYGVMTPSGGHGWMHVSVILFEPASVASLPLAAGDLHVVDMPMSHPTAAPPAVDPTLAMAGLNQAEIVALPPTDPAAATAAVAPRVPVELTLQVCEFAR